MKNSIIKKMAICLALFTFLSTFTASATKKIVRSIDYQGANGSFDYTRYESGTHIYILCWAAENCGTCPMSVPNTAGNEQFDVHDEMSQEQLFSEAEENVGEGIENGLLTTKVHVEGEAEMRIYQVAWLSTDANTVTMTWSRLR